MSLTEQQKDKPMCTWAPDGLKWPFTYTGPAGWTPFTLPRRQWRTLDVALSTHTFSNSSHSDSEMRTAGLHKQNVCRNGNLTTWLNQEDNRIKIYH